MDNKDNSLQFFIWFSIVIPIIYLLTHLMTDMQLSVNGDMNSHIQFAKEWIRGERDLAYPAWHIMVLFFSYICNGSIQAGATITNFIYAVLSYIVIVWVSTWFFDIKKYGAMGVVISVLMVFIGPLIYMPWYSGRYLLEHGVSFNIWHNPTNSAVKFISVLVVFLFIKIYSMSDSKQPNLNKKDSDLLWKRFIGCGVLAAISALIKPSFLQVFIPSLGVFLLLELIITKKSITYLFKIGLCFLPTVMIIAIQWLIIYVTKTSYTDNDSIAIGILTVWGAFTPNVLVSIFLSLAFPIYIYILYRKYILENKYLMFSAIFLFISMLEFGVLYESGDRKFHGNFIWGYSIATGISFLVCIIYFFKYCLDKEKKLCLKKKVNICAGTVLLTSHFIWGVWYYILLISTRVAQRG